jgi:hypothetical protein
MGWNSNKDTDNDPSVSNSHLFLVRLWLEDLGADQQEWRGRVQHILSGQVRYFREWTALETIFRNMASVLVSDGAAEANHSPTPNAKGSDKPVL